jgi:hypothetical protein
MSLEHTYSVAKSIQPFVKGGGQISTEGIYKLMMTNEHLSFIRQMFSVENIPLLVFVTYEISKGNDYPNIVGEIYHNLFYFNIFEFGDTENEIDCYECGGEGRVDCSDCDGTGQITCNDCDGTGLDDEEYTCQTCDGEENIECEWCGGDGRNNCDECDGRGGVTVYDEVPYGLYYCVSYDKELNVDLDQTILRNEPINLNPTQKMKTLILSVDTINVGESSDTEEISNNYANDSYGGVTLLPDEVTLRYGAGNKIWVKELDMKPEKFFN